MDAFVFLLLIIFFIKLTSYGTSEPLVLKVKSTVPNYCTVSAIAEFNRKPLIEGPDTTDEAWALYWIALTKIRQFEKLPGVPTADITPIHYLQLASELAEAGMYLKHMDPIAVFWVIDLEPYFDLTEA